MTTHTLQLAAAVPWAIQPHWLSMVLRIANREGPGPEAVELELGRPLDNAQVATVRDGVAIVPMLGPIFRRANMFSRVSGATSVDVLARDVKAALEDPSIRSILLHVDSPGGEVTGVHEIAAYLFSQRGTKPIRAYVGGTCASAAYWIASACDRITLDATALVGSIGVVQAVPNPEAAVAEDIEIVSSQSPKKRPDVATKGGRATIQATVDRLADVFVADVARNRGVSVDDVLATFGEGWVLVGADALAAGMVDSVGSFEGTVAEMVAASSPRRPPMRLAAGKANPMTVQSNSSSAVAAAETPAIVAAETVDVQPEAAKPEPDPMKKCGKCEAKSGAEAKFCAGCGAKFPIPSDDGEDAKKAAAQLLELTAAATTDEALGIVAAWKAQAEGRAKFEADSERSRIIATLVDEKKLTAAMEQWARAESTSLASLRQFAAAATPIAQFAPPTVEPGVRDSKRWEDHKPAQLAALKTENPALYDSLYQDYRARKGQ